MAGRATHHLLCWIKQRELAAARKHLRIVLVVLLGRGSDAAAGWSARAGSGPGSKRLLARALRDIPAETRHATAPRPTTNLRDGARCHARECHGCRVHA